MATSDRLARARDYIARGEDYYRKAAEEIVAAMKEDTTLSYRQVGRDLKRDESWVRRLVTWSTNAASTAQTPFAEESGQVARRHARSVLLKSDPDQIAEQFLSDPEIRAKLSKAQDIAHRQVEERSRQAQREAVGERESDELDAQQRWHDAEAELFRARRAVIEWLRIVNSADTERLVDSWREEFLRTLDDIADKVQLGRDLLAGTLGDELDKLLAGEV